MKKSFGRLLEENTGVRKARWRALQVNRWWGLKNAGEEKSLEVNLTAKTLPFMLAGAPFHLPLLPEERGQGG